MRSGLIYLITNTVNGKRYIGQTVRTLRQRWQQHVRDAKQGVDTLL
jgi:predicted GIY-YIG superfamily endonuclease